MNISLSYPAATYYVRVSGDSMEKAGIFHNAILIVDKSREPCDGNIVVANIDDETSRT